MVEYARKSRREKDDATRVRLLQQMCRDLRKRSLVNKVFVSVSCDANGLLLERDIGKQEQIISKIKVDGDMQGEKRLYNVIKTITKLCCIR